MPFAARWPIADCDLLLSFSHCIAKAAKAPPGVPHVSYCFTPMRYAWHLRDAYFQGVKGRVLGPLLSRLRDWDRRTAERVSHFIAISRTIQQRIRECYGRSSTVIHPPVDTEFYAPSPVVREDFYLVVSAFVPYKRFDLAVEACTKLKKCLVVIGRGPQEAKLKALAGPTVRFLGWQPDEVIRDHYRRAKALLFPPEEDFGIVPVEAQSCGCPVLAFGEGGSRETVTSGLFFDEQTVGAVVDAIERFERSSDAFDPSEARRAALPFGQARYERELFGFVERVLAGPSKMAA
jgi:glycosyltransferase involved in cell wall biosynthesis